MKRNPLQSFKFCSLSIVALIAIIIFTPACQEETEYHPSARFVIKGTVLSESDKEPLKDILVIMFENRIRMNANVTETVPIPKDSAITDENGMFVVTDSLATPAALTYSITFIDPANRLKDADEKENISHACEFKHPVFSNGDGHWYAGETVKDSIFMLLTN